MNAKKLDKSKLKLWTRPNSYVGPNYYDYYTLPSECGITRDSDALARSNYRVALEMLGGESDASETDAPAVIVIRDSHWACGWIECIRVHKDAADKVAILIDIIDKLENYPVLDEMDWSQEESREADETFGNFKHEFIQTILTHLGFKHPDMTPRNTKAKELEELASEIYHESVSNSGIDNAWVNERSIKDFMCSATRGYANNSDIYNNRFYKLLKG